MSMISRAWISMSVAWPEKPAVHLVDQDLGVRRLMRFPLAPPATAALPSTMRCRSRWSPRRGLMNCIVSIDPHAGIDAAARGVDVDGDVLSGSSDSDG